jgi:hypothetical protein
MVSGEGSLGGGARRAESPPPHPTAVRRGGPAVDSGGMVI